MNFIEKTKLAWLLNKARKQIMWEKLQSRKLWVVVVTATVTALGGQLGIDPDITGKLIALAAAYVLGQGAVDAVEKAKK